MKDKGIPFPNLVANILLKAPTLGANNLFLKTFDTMHMDQEEWLLMDMDMDINKSRK